jgi:hypothetical protein
MVFREKAHNKRMKIIDKIKKLFTSKNDPDGMYTGNPTDGGKPTQDADDL